MSYSSDRVRREWAENDRLRDAGLDYPDSVDRFLDIRYGDHPLQKLDIYVPRGASGPLPLFVLVHGGGWVYGSKELYSFYGADMAKRGFAVVNYSYRLAPESKFPAQLEDSVNAIKWAYENADAYLIDRERIFLAGDSAGGHIAVLITRLFTDPEYSVKTGVRVPEGINVKGLLLNCASFDPADPDVIRAVLDTPESERSRFDDDTRAFPEFMEDLMEDPLDPAQRELINCFKQIDDRFPPMFLMSALGDYLLKDTYNMDKFLNKRGIWHVTKIAGTVDTPLKHVFHVDMRVPEGQAMNDLERDFLMGIR